MGTPDRRQYNPFLRAKEELNKPLGPEPDEFGLKTLDTIEEKDVEWLIPGYLPKGQITLICGTGGVGKTSVWMSLLASFSSGDKTIFDGSVPQEKRKPVKCMFFSSEDSVSSVIKKRIREQGATMRNISTIELEDPQFDEIQFGSELLENMLAKHKPVLCVFDPLQAFIDKKVKMAERNAMRQSMRSLIEYGAKYGTTFLIVMHSNKQQNVWGRNRMADSADLWDIARCVWMVGDTPDEDIKYLSHEKSNYGRTGKTLLFKNVGGRPTWEAWSDLKDRDYVLAAARKRDDAKSQDAIRDAEDAILSELTDHPAGVPAQDINELLKLIGFSDREIRTAKKNLKERLAISYTKQGLGGQWVIKKR